MAAAPFDVLTTTASELQILLASGTVTSAQLIEVYLAEIERNNGYLKAVICTAPKNSLIEKASALDRERSSGTTRSHLHGLPMLVKDNLNTHPDLGMDTTAGSFALAGARPKKSAEVVGRLIEAGVIILGKANLSELSWFNQSAYVRGGIRDDDTFGGHSNPDGSSSGSAIAVSAGLTPLALGTETDGSLIMPANRAALYTMKPTIGIVSQQGIVPVSQICDTAGPMTKSVLDLAHLMDIIVDPTKTSVPPKGFASVMTDTWADIRRDEFEDAYSRIELLAKTFQKYVPLPNGNDLEFNGADSLSTLWNGHFKAVFEDYTAGLEYSQVYTLEELVEFNRKHSETELPPRHPKQDKLEEALATKLSPETLDATLQYAREVSRTKGIDKILEDYNLDVIIGPAESSMTDIAAASGYPIASLPLGYLDFNGRPFGMAALASAHQEATLIKVQSAWEATFPPRHPPPRENFEAS
ncbi:MAG: hypothetical protein LQ349_008177 [Xanthoria aureola]|nr:MAG: hypothetical protein LQ349_008177 [Xanthoria aureola]